MKSLGRKIMYGLLIYVAWNVGLFIVSMVMGFEGAGSVSRQDMMVGSLGAAIFVVLAAWWSARRLRLINQKERFMAGIVWMIEVIILLLIVTIGNKTTGHVFGQWIAYISFLAIVAGALWGKPKVKVVL